MALEKIQNFQLSPMLKRARGTDGREEINFPFLPEKKGDVKENKGKDYDNINYKRQ